MKLNLSDLKEKGSLKKVETELQLNTFSYRQDEIETPQPFQLKLDVFNTGDAFFLAGSLKGIVRLKCSRCLEKFIHHVDVQLEDELLKSEIEDFSAVDLTDILQENILLAIPIKPLCSSDCKGLCAICGQNLNEQECGCEREFVDPRLAKLKEFFTDNDK